MPTILHRNKGPHIRTTRLHPHSHTTKRRQLYPARKPRNIATISHSHKQSFIHDQSTYHKSIDSPLLQQNLKRHKYQTLQSITQLPLRLCHVPPITITNAPNIGNPHLFTTTTLNPLHINLTDAIRTTQSIPSSSVFRRTTPQRDVSRLLILSTTAILGIGYHLYHKSNDEYFQMMERLEREAMQHKTSGETLSPQAKKLLNARNRSPANADEGDRTDQNNPFVPKLQEQYRYEDVRGDRDLEAEIDELDEDSDDMGYADDLVGNGEIGKKEYEIEQQRAYLGHIMQRYDRVVDAALRFPQRFNYDKSLQVLGIELMDVSKEAIDEAFRRLMNINHPDKGGTPYLAQRITEARTVLWHHARSDPTYKKRFETKEANRRQKEDSVFLEQLRRRLDVIKRRREIMLFRKSMWGTPRMNREPMIVENEASRRVHNLDYGILQMNRGQWPTITFNGWKPRIFRNEEENERWEEFQIIHDELKTSKMRREIDQYHELQNRDWEIVKFEYKNRILREKQADLRPLTSITYDERSHWDKYNERMDWTPLAAQMDEKRERVNKDLLMNVWGEQPKRMQRRGRKDHPQSRKRRKVLKKRQRGLKNFGVTNTAKAWKRYAPH